MRIYGVTNLSDTCKPYNLRLYVLHLDGGKGFLIAFQQNKKKIIRVIAPGTANDNRVNGF